MAISPVPSSLRQAFGQLMTSAIQSGNLFAAKAPIRRSRVSANSDPTSTDLIDVTV